MSLSDDDDLLDRRLDEEAEDEDEDLPSDRLMHFGQRDFSWLGSEQAEEEEEDDRSFFLSLLLPLPLLVIMLGMLVVVVLFRDDTGDEIDDPWTILFPLSFTG